MNEKDKLELITKAKATGEKQLLKTESYLARDGNLILQYYYINEEGEISTNNYYDGD